LRCISRESRQMVESSRGGRGLAAARMSDERDPVEIHLAFKGVAFRLVPLSEKLEVFEQQPTSSRRLLQIQAVGPTAVDEVFVYGSQDVSAAGQQTPQVFVAGIGEVLCVVVAVDNQHQ